MTSSRFLEINFLSRLTNYYNAVKTPHGEYSKEILYSLDSSNVPQIEFQDGTVYHS